MTPVNLGGAAPLVIIKPERGLSTPLVYRAYDGGEKAPPSRIPEAIAALQKGDYRALRELLHNALYPPAKGLLPELQELLSLLYKKGALFAAMTGNITAMAPIIIEIRLPAAFFTKLDISSSFMPSGSPCFP